MSQYFKFSSESLYWIEREIEIFFDSYSSVIEKIYDNVIIDLKNQKEELDLKIKNFDYDDSFSSYDAYSTLNEYIKWIEDWRDKKYDERYEIENNFYNVLNQLKEMKFENEGEKIRYIVDFANNKIERKMVLKRGAFREFICTFFEPGTYVRHLWDDNVETIISFENKKIGIYCDYDNGILESIEFYLDIWKKIKIDIYSK